MNAAVLKRFILYMAAFIVVAMVGSDLLRGFLDRAPGDYRAETGSNRLEDGLYVQALAEFDQALIEAPGHVGAMMGRGLALAQMNKADEADAAFTALIERLEADSDSSIRALAVAHANRGIARDRAGAQETALADYERALALDADSVSGPGLIDRVLYRTPDPATVRKRADYLRVQLALPEGGRRLRVPELDAQERMHKP